MSYVDNTQLIGPDWKRLATRLTVGAIAGIMLVDVIAVAMVGLGAAAEEQFTDNVSVESNDDPLEFSD
ncbi:hypothetical protein EA462_15505 [Natrarchaeobius halalkaliphilus]|uniref:Uncharacterized protein n=1 Tax=Natrarchaeobius halalkaliphilus TaxID=1679091 RepID=A0A3N6LN79_9EURY|nr:hypothetical protein [Natrarchaeobius halalkaliphilus]RQG87045.1 hypothetical protein EA462_15505 [Natrarchaeobius halalkaliphilus]